MSSISGKRLWTDQQVDALIGNLLRGGVLLSAGVVLIGGIIYLIRHGAAAPDYWVFRGEPTDLRTVPGILTDALTFRGRGLIQLGLLLLVATPVARVALAVIAFAEQRDRTYVLISATVLAVLLYSLCGGRL